MGAESKVVVQESIPVVDGQLDVKSPEISACFPRVCSGSFSDIGPRRYMEDEHIRMDDLSQHIKGSLTGFPKPTAFYGVFDGHGGADASAYVGKNAIKFFFEDSKFPQTWEVDDSFLLEVEKCLRNGFLLADRALKGDSSVSNCCGTTALTVLVLGRFLLVANVGDCRAVLCRKGCAIDMSRDHRPTSLSERIRVEECNGFINDGYLNGVLSVTRALGDWDMKGSNPSSPLISEPEFQRIFLTDDDEFLIIGCDGIWDVLSSQQAVSLVRRGLRRHNNPDQCAKDLVMEAIRLNTFDNLTVVIVCFNSMDQTVVDTSATRQRRLRCCSFSTEALCRLRSYLDGGSNNNNGVYNKE